MGSRAVVAMSGGVDSSVAAWLMKERGYECAGVTMRQFRNGDIDWQGTGVCCSWRDMGDAAKVALLLGIPHTVLDFTAEFRREVIDRFVQVYQSGGTPNPCLDCNRCMRAGHLMDYVRKMGFDCMATGHYARIEYDEASGRWLLKKGLDESKDQSYVHYAMTQEQLSRTRFPLGTLRKAEVRGLAEELGFTNARKRDSQDICFVPDGDYAGFLRRYTGRDWPKGPFLDEAGNVLGTHEGIVNYTVGQRRGLGVSSSRGRLYVKEIRPADNAVVLSGNASLFTGTVTADRLNWIAVERLSAPLRLRARLRYHMEEQPCTAEQTGPDTLRVTFDRPQRAAAPGQALVLYDGDVVVGGGTITREERRA